jgi:hypothetical protein
MVFRRGDESSLTVAWMLPEAHRDFEPHQAPQKHDIM